MYFSEQRKALKSTSTNKNKYIIFVLSTTICEVLCLKNTLLNLF